MLQFTYFYIVEVSIVIVTLNSHSYGYLSTFVFQLLMQTYKKTTYYHCNFRSSDFDYISTITNELYTFIRFYHANCILLFQLDECSLASLVRQI